MAIELENQCVQCKTIGRHEVRQDQLMQYQAGALVQDVWPYEDAEVREFIIAHRSGHWVCPACWIQLFGEEEYDE